MFKASLAFAVAACCAGMIGSAQAAPLKPNVDALVTPAMIDGFRAMLEVPVITMSIKAQNERRQGLDQTAIDTLDREWRSETEADDQPLIAATLSSPASSYLTQLQAEARGLFAALFVMDEYGLNVGQSVVTSDYWQGDEAKFTETFPNGPGAVFIDEPEYDDALGAWLAQVNMTLTSDGQAIGTATVEVDLTELAHRAQTAR